MFDKESQIYDAFYQDKDYAREVDEVVALLSGTSILDIGCGTGRHGELFMQRGFTVLGIEPCEAMAVRARARGIAVQNTYEVSALFDNAVLLFDVFNFLDDPDATIGKIAQAVRPGGMLVFDAWDASLPTKRFGISKRNGIVRLAYKKKQKNRVTVYFLYLPRFVIGKHAISLHADDEIRAIVERNGFVYDKKVGRWWCFKRI